LDVASAQVREEWVARYDGLVHQNDSAADIALDAWGNVYVTGTSCIGFDTRVGCIDYDWATVKYDTAGNRLWSASYNAPGSFQDANAVAVDGAGNVYVTGSVCVGESWDELGGYCFESHYATVKYDPNGNQLWVARYDNLAWVVLGTTLGMMFANIPAVIVGETLAHRIPMKVIRWLAAALFVAVGIATLLGVGQLPL
jgi:hypothetical protein